MKKYITLISLLFLCAASQGAPHIRKCRNHRRIMPAVITQSTNTDSVSSDSLLAFARSLMGIRYRAGSASPSNGFDCSGFVSYVFKSFNFDVPRSSSDFATIGQTISLENARPGDIILFTGTKSHHLHSIGHVGIVCCNEGGLTFIHSTSGKEHGVTISEFDDTYKRRFVQVVRLLK